MKMDGGTNIRRTFVSRKNVFSELVRVKIREGCINLSGAFVFASSRLHRILLRMLLFRNCFVAERAGLPMLKRSSSLPSDRRARLPEREMAKDYVRNREY